MKLLEITNREEWEAFQTRQPWAQFTQSWAWGEFRKNRGCAVRRFALVDDAGNWTVRKDVYYYDAREKHGAPLSATANNGKSIGPELGFGYVMGQVLDELVRQFETRAWERYTVP